MIPLVVAGAAAPPAPAADLRRGKDSGFAGTNRVPEYL
jgi:hypothetical protein